MCGEYEISVADPLQIIDPLVMVLLTQLSI